MKVLNFETEQTNDVRLPKRFKRKWLKALRSGKFEQGRGDLEKKNLEGESTYCCLGIACRIQHPRIKIKGGWIDKENFKRLRDIDVPEILKGDGESNQVVEKLADMNDSGKSFAEIADFIEKEL